MTGRISLKLLPVVLLLAVPVFAKCSPKIPATLPITSTFPGYDAANNVADIQSDGLNGGTYSDGIGGITSYLTCNGYNGQAFADWQFDALTSTVRQVSLSFVNGIQPSAGGTAVPNPPFTIKNVNAHVEDKCSQIANGAGGYNNMLQMHAGQMFQCPLIAHFYDSNGSEYRIYMGPNWEPETTYVQVACNAVASDNSGCNDWFIDPSPANSSGAVGRLVFFGKRTTTNDGDFYFHFHFHLTRP
jgi:hypothetical protein